MAAQRTVLIDKELVLQRRDVKQKRDQLLLLALHIFLYTRKFILQLGLFVRLNKGRISPNTVWDSMRAARAVRQLSQLGCWGASRNVSRGLGDAWNVQRRGFWALRLMRGVHDVVGHAISLGEYATGVQPSRAAERSSPAAQDTTTRENPEFDYTDIPFC